MWAEIRKGEVGRELEAPRSLNVARLRFELAPFDPSGGAVANRIDRPGRLL